MTCTLEVLVLLAAVERRDVVTEHREHNRVTYPLLVDVIGLNNHVLAVRGSAETNLQLQYRGRIVPARSQFVQNAGQLDFVATLDAGL